MKYHITITEASVYEVDAENQREAIELLLQDRFTGSVGAFGSSCESHGDGPTTITVLEVHK